jgi:hypothetical protein
MQKFKLEDMFRGWFIGNFTPSLYKTNDIEVGVKKYKKGDKETAHYHKIATEFTLVLDGCIKMAGQEYGNGDIVKIDPFDVTDFEALTDATTVVVKLPGVNNDKYEKD